MGFRGQGIEPAHGFTGEGFIGRPLTPSDVVLDYDGVIVEPRVPFPLGAGTAISVSDGSTTTGPRTCTRPTFSPDVSLGFKDL